ncbi:MAG TPA: acyl-CoA dehydrogenase family protein, partial [Gammaproteobacteria bacterium]
MVEFFQQGPELENTWTADPFLRSALERLMPATVFTAIAPGLERLGERAAFEMPRYAADAERHPPEHIPFDPWGRRIDHIRINDGWKQLHRVAAEEGIVATAYEREHGEHSRLHQFARLYLYHPSSAICSCPMAMTDGAARIIELHGPGAMRAKLLHRLVSRDPETFWTSGQWMTERAGGSDVSGTATVARKDGDHYRLTGTKWFTSATTSQMALTLARIEENGKASAQLSLFSIEQRDADGKLNGIRVRRLKDKLGTRALPTAELDLVDAPAVLIGEPGKGVRTIATLLNITRLYNACSSASQMRRGVMLANDYARKRVAFGKPLAEHPLHGETLAVLEAETRGATLMVLHAAALLGKEETGTAS